ncbi:hypothetical protein H4S01_001300 [Coemansia sp. RSA 2610]|nr:hypothetical protein H4S01_001300 [Coemansia sp. RSA 2610]
MNAHHGEDNIDQLSSQTAGSPYHYTNHKDAADAGGRLSAQGSACTDVDTDAGANASNGAAKGNVRSHSGAGKANGVSGSGQTWAGRKRGDSRVALDQHIYRFRPNVSAKAPKPLTDARIYRSPSTEPTHTYYEKAMRRSTHRLVSATTQFDRMTTGALSLLADVGRLYLTRLGEACRARADLAGRVEPNVFDVVDAGPGDLGVDWEPLRRWVDEWKAEVGDAVPGHAQPARNRDVGLGAGILGGEDIDDIIGSMDLSSILLSDSGVGDDTDGIVPPHLPPLVPMADDEAAEAPAEGVSAAQLEPPAGTTNGAAERKQRQRESASPDALDGEETAESIAAHMQHVVSAALAKLPTAVTSNKALYAYFRVSNKSDASGVPEDVLPDFEIPAVALVPAPDYIKQQLARKEKLSAGMPMFLAASSAQRDVLGDVETEWREARHRLYADIYDEAAEQAMAEMDNAPMPMRERRASDEPDSDDEELEQASGDDDDVIDRATGGGELGRMGDVDEMGHMGNRELDPALTTAATDADAILAEEDLDISIDEDVEEMDLGMDLNLDMDLNIDPDLDIVGGHADTRHADLDVVGGSPEAAPEDDAPTVELEEVAEPVTSGLRGSGREHWSNAWFTAAMDARLSRITAQDILPSDSLFLGEPDSGTRHVVDEIACAFVDSEGGGHMHATTPLAGFGPPRNTISVPAASGSALRWTLHHLMQTRGTRTVDSLYSGRAALAGGVAGDGIAQYAARVCSLIKGSVEEEAALVVDGALRADSGCPPWANPHLPTPEHLMPLLIAGAEKRIPWAQERLDIHAIEASVVGRKPQSVPARPMLLTAADPASPSDPPDSADHSGQVVEHPDTLAP